MAGSIKHQLGISTLSKSRLCIGGSIASVAAATGGAILPAPAFAQDVADRTLSDVKVDKLGGCSTLTFGFNSRMQLLSSFPIGGGRELHIRLNPLDPVHRASLRESLRTPASLPALRSIEYEGDNPSGPVLSLLFTRAMRFDVAPGQQPNTLIVRLAEPGAGQLCDTREVAPAAPPSATAASAPPAAARPGIAMPSGLFVINLKSVPGMLGDLTANQRAALEGKIAYETDFERDSQRWRRLRLGFFDNRKEADTALAKLAGQFPGAWVIKVTTEERAQGVASRIETGAPPRTSAPAQTGAVAGEGDTMATAELIGQAEEAIKAGENDRAIALLTNALAKPESTNTPRTLELLGLTRERKGQAAHAQAEYEEYLRRYPSGEAAERVSQRLAAIKSPGSGQASAPLREASGSARTVKDWTWGLRGSFSEFYYRDESSTKTPPSGPTLGTEVDNSVNVNQLQTSADVTFTGGNDRHQMQVRAAGSWTKNFGGSTSTTTIDNGASTIVFRTRPGGSQTSLSALYLDYSNNDLNTSLRIGRQTRNSQGILGRFDGALVGWQTQPKLRLNLAAGFPVESSRNKFIDSRRFFYGASVDVGARHDALQTTVYFFNQNARGGFVDRRSVGVEARFLKKSFNAYALLDYDIKFKKLNLGLITLNYMFPDASNLNITADYRQSPLLRTGNALTGQIDPVTLLPFDDLDGLRPYYTDDDIYQLAKDRTLVAKSITVSYSKPMSKKLQANFDFTLTDTGGTPASGNPVTGLIGAIPATGKEYYYGLQLVGTGLFWQSDIYILSGRLADTQRAKTLTGDFNARIPITSNFRLSPRVRYSLRRDKPGAVFLPSTFKQLQPSLRLNYYPSKRAEVELEVGTNFTSQGAIGAPSNMRTRESGFFFSGGFRIDF